MLIPFMWVTKLRQARLLSKVRSNVFHLNWFAYLLPDILQILLNALLPIAAKLDFVMPLLPAPYQVALMDTSASDVEFYPSNGVNIL